MFSIRLIAPLLLVLSSACVTTERDMSGLGAAKRQLASEAQGWTTEFLRNRLIVADQVRISGPKGLRAHLASRFDPLVHSKVEKTTRDGFLQTFQPREASASQMSAYLDKLEIHALQKLSILERPGPVDVVVEAVGDVYYVDVDAAREERVPSLRLVGVVQR